MNEPQCQDENGNWVPAEPCHLMCEHPGCRVEVLSTEQYVRENTNLPNGWGNEPEFLCVAHSIGRTAIAPQK